MFLSAVVLILQEILEAALLVSVMLMFTHLFNQLWQGTILLTRYWVLYSIVLGGLCAAIFAYYTPAISVWFDYVGQEIANAAIHIVSLTLLMILAFLVPASSLDAKPRVRSRLILVCMTGVVLFSIVREGSEIMLYLIGVTSQPENVTATIFGSLLGAGIGISTGILLFYSLMSLNNKWAFRAGLILLCLSAGNMAAQSALLLIQADWLPYTPALWNSSALISETSVVGRLLYALVGYEATPSAAQVICYGAGMLAVVVSPLCRRLLWNNQVIGAVPKAVA